MIDAEEILLTLGRVLGDSGVFTTQATAAAESEMAPGGRWLSKPGAICPVIVADVCKQMLNSFIMVYRFLCTAG